jgi:hypothetical protein
VQETRHYDAQGRELLEGSGGAAAGRRIEDVSGGEDVGGSDKQASQALQAQRDALYEERMEDEYAKREGGA